MWKEHREQTDQQMVVEVCASTLRVAYLRREERSDRGQDQESKPTIVFRSVKWRSQSSSLLSAEGVEEFRAALQTLVSKEKLNNHRARIVLNGDFCVTRVVRGMLDEVQRELAQLQDRSHRYLSLGPGEKASAVSLHQVDARHHHALMTVANREVLSSLAQAAKDAGLHVTHIEPSLVALSRLIGQLSFDRDEPTAIMQLDERGVEFGISYQGQLLLDYRPGGRSARDKVAMIVSQHWGRLQRYSARHFRNSQHDLSRLYVGGAAQDVSLVLSGFRGNMRIEVKPLEVKWEELPWDSELGTFDTEFAATVGACLATDNSKSDFAGPDLLDFAQHQSQTSIRPLVGRTLAPLAAVLLIAIALLGMNLHESNLCSGLEHKLGENQAKVNKALEYRAQVSRAMTHLEHLHDIESQTTRPDWARLLTLFGKTMPGDVWLDQLNYVDQEGVSLVGASYNEEGIYDFVRALEGSPRISGVTLNGTRLTRFRSGPATQFEIGFKYNDERKNGDKENSDD